MGNSSVKSSPEEPRTKRIFNKLKRRSKERQSAVAEIKRQPISDWISGKMFSLVHGNNLVYNCCWEDPRLDRVALEIGPEDRIVVITSAGCNALDYALQEPAKINAVDMNPRQNALLELKVAGIKALEYEDFFQIFGRGHHDEFRKLLDGPLRPHLSSWTYDYWQKKHIYFEGKRSFYLRGSSGAVARFMNMMINRRKMRDDIEELLEAKTLKEQQEIYDRSIREEFWSGRLKKIVGSDVMLSFLGVPRPQRQQVELHYQNGIETFIEDCIETVFTKIPIHDNYFWRVYLTGEYTSECSPEYLKPDNFQKLKDGLVDCIQTHTTTVESFLRGTEEKISRFILLDHMDWLSTFRYKALESEWQAIVDSAAPETKIIYRSGGTKVEYVEPIKVEVEGSQKTMGDLMTFHPELASELHEKDRVHTYGCFYIADLDVSKG